MFTQYLVSLRVFNPEGAGPDTIVVVMTDEGGERCHNVNIISYNHFWSRKFAGFIHSYGDATFDDISFASSPFFSILTS